MKNPPANKQVHHPVLQLLGDLPTGAGDNFSPHGTNPLQQMPSKLALGNLLHYAVLFPAGRQALGNQCSSGATVLRHSLPSSEPPPGLQHPLHGVIQPSPHNGGPAPPGRTVHPPIGEAGHPGPSSAQHPHQASPPRPTQYQDSPVPASKQPLCKAPHVPGPRPPGPQALHHAPLPGPAPVPHQHRRRGPRPPGPPLHHALQCPPAGQPQQSGITPGAGARLAPAAQRAAGAGGLREAAQHRAQRCAAVAGGL
mmetsp:Transcript_106709/g.244340  ORF Transcript_106709/g.244340 Transcript_106709/m.244340 type:complete len:253 (-) Transcript_106709:1492-2250(-)